MSSRVPSSAPATTIRECAKLANRFRDVVSDAAGGSWTIAGDVVEDLLEIVGRIRLVGILGQSVALVRERAAMNFASSLAKGGGPDQR